jgi:hypothetical protein
MLSGFHRVAKSALTIAAVTNPLAGGRIRRIEHGLQFLLVQVGNQPAVGLLERDREDAATAHCAERSQALRRRAR